MNNQIHTENTFESAIIDHLVDVNGWILGNAVEFSAELAFDKKAILAFVQDSQQKEWQKYQSYYPQDAETKFIQRLFKELDLRGMLDVLRHGITDSGIKFRLAYFKPDSGLNPDTLALYQKNKLYVTRQVYFSKNNRKSLDLLLSINGLPVATIELKNHFTGQTVADAMEQYKTSRDPKELLFQFKKRALVHFTLDPDDVYLTTKLDSHFTRFLPFNKGFNGGAGNPPNGYGYKTAYFWEEILRGDSWLDIIGRYIHLEKKDYKVEGITYTREALIFPRFHQIDVVRSISNTAKTNGTGKNYLIQHSAGSGKSNSIAWLAYRLSSLYDVNDKKVFDSVVVVTDRNVLDQQLQNTIYQFEHKTGVVQRIDKDSEQLANAIKNGTNIIITTLQKFPFAVKHFSESINRKYAVIIDEAHSSQGGEASEKMKKVLGIAGKTEQEILEEAEAEQAQTDNQILDSEELILRTILEKGKQPNISFFAFTATPKPKTLELFGEKAENGKFIPSHLYSMKQAIEEGFILDVLKNYHTYKEYYSFSKKIEDDPELNKKKAVRAIGRFISLHPTSLAQKTEVMIEHFRQITMKKIGGKAKAMVVTASRKHALRYYLEFKSYIQEKNYMDIKALVAFSGTLYDDNYEEGVTEAQLNGFGEKELPEKFDTDEYRVLLVADKYQTGFDQPLLHTMFVDKKISGIKAVQTLSRLNRTREGKEDTFILDFANEREVILASFQDYYEQTNLAKETDPNHLYDLKNKLDATQIYYQSEVDAFSKVFYMASDTSSTKDQARLYALIDPSVDRYNKQNEEVQDSFKESMTAFVRLYAFLSQIIPFQDIELEKLYTFGRFMLNKLPKADYTDRLKLDNEVALEYYRLQKIADGSLLLQMQGGQELQPTTEAGIKRDKGTKDHLSNIIQQLNQKYGTDFNEADKLYFDQILEDFCLDEDLKRRAENNPIDNFKYAFEEVFINKLIERMETNEDIFERIMSDSQFKEDVKEWLVRGIYERLKK
jgi:type I restriction enzyme, R subunit